VAKVSADVIILDDNFSTVVIVAKWGRWSISVHQYSEVCAVLADSQFGCSHCKLPLGLLDRYFMEIYFSFTK
jgi:hypothetical protein